MDYDVFISYSSEDRDDIAFPLAEQLRNRGLSVWFDKFILGLGDSLRRSIDKGLSNSRFGIVVLSPAFFQKEWTKKELDGLVAREDGREKIILPIWHNIDHEVIVRYSPMLADKLAISTSQGLSTVTEEIIKAVNGAAKNISKTQTINKIDGLTLVWIPPGTFDMGVVRGDDNYYPDEIPQHPVKISEGFWMSSTPVTVAAFERYCQMQNIPMPPFPDFNRDWQHKEHPIVRVTWQDAVDYCTWVGGRLPSEAEWEYAARGGKKDLKYPWGNEITHNHANYSGKGTVPVRSFSPNAFGLYEIVGNVCEWTSDWYDGDYYYRLPRREFSVDPAGSLSPNPEADSSKPGKVLRGVSWYYNKSDMRISRRLKFDPNERDFSNGFRYIVNQQKAG